MNQTPEYLLGPHKTTIIAAARELLHASAAGGVAFEIPGLEPRHVVVLGAESEIGKLLEAPAREPMIGGRRKEDVRPAEPLDWNEPEEGEPRRWTILVTSAGHGLVGELGHSFPHAEEKHERVDVVEAGPVLARIAELRGVLRDVRHALQFANDSPNGGITDTLWMMHRPETVFDFIDAALAVEDAQVRKEGKEG